MDKLIQSLNLRAKQVGVKQLVSSTSSEIKLEEQKEADTKSKTKPAGTVINIQGNVTGSTIVIGDDNKVDTD
jgi:hypothetical protein